MKTYTPGQIVYTKLPAPSLVVVEQQGKHTWCRQAGGDFVLMPTDCLSDTPPAPPTHPKVGDRVKWKNWGHHTVLSEPNLRTPPNGMHYIAVKIENAYGERRWVRIEELELVSETEPKFKPGDLVTLSGDRDTRVFEVLDPCVPAYINGVLKHAVKITDVDQKVSCRAYDFAHESNLTLVEPFKVGDIVRTKAAYEGHPLAPCLPGAVTKLYTDKGVLQAVRVGGTMVDPKFIELVPQETITLGDKSFPKPVTKDATWCVDVVVSQKVDLSHYPDGLTHTTAEAAHAHRQALLEFNKDLVSKT